jgi:antitoxin HigA-1
MTPNNQLPAVHAGEFLAEILEDTSMTVSTFSRSIGVPIIKIAAILQGTSPITVELSLLFGKAFGQSPKYWLNLQTAYDLKLGRQ